MEIVPKRECINGEDMDMNMERLRDQQQLPTSTNTKRHDYRPAPTRGPAQHLAPDPIPWPSASHAGNDAASP